MRIFYYKARVFWEEYKLPILIFLISRLIVFLTFYFTNQYHVGNGSLTQWDAHSYLSIAKNGYVFNGSYLNSGSFIAFFPLWPLLIKVFSFLSFLNLTSSALVLSFVFGLCSVVLLYNIAKSFFGEKAGINAVFLFSFFPLSVFLTVPYTESLFCLLVLAVFYCFEKKKFLISSVLISLALVTRITGMILIPILMFEFYKNKTRAIYSLTNLIICIIPFGIFTYFQYQLYGNPFAFVTAEKINWFHETVFPWVGIANLVGYLNKGIMWQVNFVFFVMMVITLFIATGKVKLRYLLFGWLVILLIICQTFPISLGRYTLVVIPFYLFWGNYFTRHSIARQLTFIVFSSWMTFNVVLFVLSLYIF